MLKNVSKRFLEIFGYALIPQKRLEDLSTLSKRGKDLSFLIEMWGKDIPLLPRYLAKSKSQCHQDIFVLSQLNFKRGGYFVEFGATNGVDLSNTYLLESEFGWTGILAEPAKCWHQNLLENRHSIVDTRCVWSRSGETLAFSEAEYAELSTISRFLTADDHKYNRKNNSKYNVNSVSLFDLLEEHRAPRLIDYLSIDTEGSEYDILMNFDFSKYKFSIITVEHNFTSSRDDINRLLSANGYVRRFENISEWDDWYILRS